MELKQHNLKNRIKIILLFLIILCIILELIPGSASYIETLDQGSRVVHNSTTYYAFTNIGKGLWIYNIVLILSIILLLSIIFKAKSGNILWISLIAAVANILAIYLYSSSTALSVIIEVILLAVLILSLSYKNSSK